MDSESTLKQLIADFEFRYNLQFENSQLIIQALKHRSFLNVTNEDRIDSNERLEFLGDAVLELILTEFLYTNYSELTEGDLSKMKAVLVSRKVLGAVALDMELGEFLLLNKGEEKMGGRNRVGILANAFEAVLGALYLDKGFDIAQSFVQKYLLDHHQNYIDEIDLYNHKSELLELMQAHALGMPEYLVTDEVGPDHDKKFIVNVSISDTLLGEGQGSSKKQAEQHAAKDALNKIKQNIIDIQQLSE